MKIFTTLFLSLFLLVSQSGQAFALVINSQESGIFVINDDDKVVTINAGGDIEDGRIFGAFFSDIVVNINANTNQGVRSDGGTLYMIGATLDLNVNSGRIANNSTSLGDSSGGVLLINSTHQGNNTIDIAAAGSIIGETANSRAINYRNNSNDATLTINNAGNILSEDNIASRGVWFFDPSGGSTLIINNSGVINSGAGTAIDVEAGNLATITNRTGGSISGAINLGTNANSKIDATGGQILGDITFGNASQEINISNGARVEGVVVGSGKINIGGGSNLDFNSGTVSANINGASPTSAGSITIRAGEDVTINSIGQTHALANFNINNNNARASVSGNINATNINIASQLSLTNPEGNIINGSIRGDREAILNLNEGSHILNGNLTLTQNNKLALTIADASRAGSITISGAANINTDNLQLTLGSNQTAAGAKYTIISSGAESILKQMNVDVDASGSNRVGILLFNTKISGNNLILEVERYKVAALTTSRHASFYDAITSVNNPTGNLGLLQNYLDSDAFSDAQKMSALDSANSQVDNSSNRLAFNNVDLSANLISNRLDVVRQGSAGVSSGDETLSKSVWMELFGSKIQQENNSSFAGYDAQTSGFTFGFDKNFEDRNLTTGLAFTYADLSA